MTKKDLIAAVSTANPHLRKVQVERAINLFFDLVTFYLMHHQRVELRGFGVFSVRHRPAHRAHNPQTGEMVVVPGKVVPFFKPSLALKQALKDSVNTSRQNRENTHRRLGLFSFLYRREPALR